jgi:hypothetical protein
MKIIFLLSLILIACSKQPNTPEAVLESFIQSRFKTSMTKEKMLTVAHGDFAKSLEEMNEIDFQKFSELDGLRFKKFSIIRKICPNQIKCHLTYNLQYETLNSLSKREVLTDVRKVAELDKIDDIWKISSITNIKTFHEGEEIIVK